MMRIILQWKEICLQFTMINFRRKPSTLFEESNPSRQKQWFPCTLQVKVRPFDLPCVLQKIELQNAAQFGATELQIKNMQPGPQETK
jgi:hypothetical protein